MAKIEPALHEHFAKARETGVVPAPLPTAQSTEPRAAGSSTTRDTAAMGRGASQLTQRSFAKVNSVVVGSPADRAGLRAGDEVMRFGDVEWSSSDRLAKVAATTGRSEGVWRSHSQMQCKLRVLIIWSLARNQGTSLPESSEWIACRASRSRFDAALGLGRPRTTRVSYH